MATAKTHRARTTGVSPLTVADAADRLNISEDAVLAHIRSHRLLAVNVGLGERRPRWRITDEAISQFLEARTAQKPSEQKSRRPKRQSVGVEFF
jgi:excisionase family DNA binding protein